VPGLEQGYRRGTAIGIFSDTATRIGVAICKDLDFVPLGRAYARAGAGLLLVPAWDFVRDGWVHSRMAVMRGIEGGFAVARSANNGLLTVSDARGRVVAERRSDDAAELLLTAVIPVGPGGTFFSRAGDWFAWLCLAGAFGCIVGTWKARWRVERVEDRPGLKL
jgi:apolipoprotein N-acyltransferase